MTHFRFWRSDIYESIAYDDVGVVISLLCTPAQTHNQPIMWQQDQNFSVHVVRYVVQWLLVSVGLLDQGFSCISSLLRWYKRKKNTPR